MLTTVVINYFCSPWITLPEDDDHAHCQVQLREPMQRLPLLPAFPPEHQDYRDRLLSLALCGFSDLN